MVRGRSLELERFEDEIRQLLADLELYSYYQLLDLLPDGSGAVAEYNFHLQAEEYRSIQQDQRCSAALYQALALILERMDEAREVLSSPPLREEYDRGLEEGHTRHQGLVQERAARRKRPSHDVRREVLERLSARLQRTIHKEYLQAPEEEAPDVSEGIEPDLLDQQSQSLQGELAGYGVVIDVSEEPAAAEPQPVDPEYLEKAARHLRREIERDGATLHEVNEAEDLSASSDAELVSGLTAQLREELETLGVPEREEVEAEAVAIDRESLDRLVWQEQRAVLDLKVDTTVKADEVLHARTVDKELAGRLTEGLEKDLGRPGVDHDGPLAAGETGGAVPAELERFDLVIPLDEEPAPMASGAGPAGEKGGREPERR